MIFASDSQSVSQSISDTNPISRASYFYPSNPGKGEVLMKIYYIQYSANTLGTCKEIL